jgi:hypothetical protein
MQQQMQQAHLAGMHAHRGKGGRFTGSLPTVFVVMLAILLPLAVLAALALFFTFFLWFAK